MRDQKNFSEKTASSAPNSAGNAPKPLSPVTNTFGAEHKDNSDDAELRKKVEARTAYLNSIKLQLS